MTWTITIGAHIVYCVMRPSFATTWCLACPPFLEPTQDEPPIEQQCRACHREILFASNRPTKPIRRLSA